MEMEPFVNPWMKKIRVLTNLLILSVAINIGLVTVFFYKSFKMHQAEKGTQPHVQIELQETNGGVLKTFFSSSMQELMNELASKVPLEDGYYRRDLALACLVNYHYFDIKRAVSGIKLQKRTLTFFHKQGGEIFTLEAFPGLSDEHFDMLTHFARKEKWPLTAEGLFYTMQKTSETLPDSLVTAFFSTPEFYSIYTLFNRGKEKIAARPLLFLLLQGKWDIIAAHIAKQETDPDIDFEGVRSLLAKFIECGISDAAKVWIELDAEYLHRRLDDVKLHNIIALIQESSPHVSVFLKQLLCSVRSDKIHKESALKLYAFAGENLQEPYDHELALKKFLPTFFSLQTKEEVSPSVKKEEKLRHVVEEGDSLWKIAKRYKVSIDEIKRENKLKNNQLRPGQELILP